MKVSRLPGQSVIVIFMAICKINVSIFCLDSGCKVPPVSLVAPMEALCCVPLLDFQCYRGWGRGEDRLFLCDAADVAQQISTFVLNEPNPGFTCTQRFFTTEIPYFVPFFTGTL